MIALAGRVATASLLVAVVAGCGSSPTPPSPPGGSTPPVIACPPALTVVSKDGTQATASFDAPVVTGGALPVTTACTPESGSTFPIGASDVSCTATDAQQRAASCTFTVTVTPPPQIGATRFLAFGDSITWGTRSSCTGENTQVAAPYPAALRALLTDRYTLQSFTVTNDGLPGERATDPSALARLGLSLEGRKPEVLLLQEGINDLQKAFNPVTQDQIIDALRLMVKEGRKRGAKLVFIGTLLPERPGSCRAFAPAEIAPLNEKIRSMAAAEGAVLVDLYAAFDGQIETLLGPDGLHPSDAGYAKIAGVFFDSIRQQLEITPPSGAPSLALVSPRAGARR